MTPEQQLQAIIEAQVEGGYRRFEFGYDEVKIDYRCEGFWCRNKRGEGQYEPSIIGFLLEPAGLKAAYKPDEEASYSPGDVTAFGIASTILDTWLSSNGNATATIQTAYDLLPNA